MLPFIAIAVVAILLTWAGSQGGASVAGVPVFAVSAVWIFALQWLAFIPAYLRQTEKFYDLTGSLSYISVVVGALLLAGTPSFTAMLIAACVLAWALRLGSFLYMRILEDGSDGRFDTIKPSVVRFLLTWNLQGLWVLVTAGCALAVITSPLTSGGSASEGSALLLLGFFLWLTGFAIEVVADRQKRIFRKRHGSDKFIDSGLWARSRHPNYFGETLLWFGIALMALAELQGWQHLTLISPLFVYLLLTRISGVTLLERKSDKRWGETPDYQTYKANTPVFVPRLFKS